MPELDELALPVREARHHLVAKRLDVEHRECGVHQLARRRALSHPAGREPQVLLDTERLEDARHLHLDADAEAV